ncbi:uncharacterized protein LOC126743396 isoform X2 [Anthonomus grandis grandis]|uniref:uncharacterized protein LOC126734842 isoform X2 n=1 Tax=Anthonomus grandis grandis TaxID=2921223 RepID=UPI0021660DF7|nr:uncharacterized protein LOC126734842 isoform X2 [Anthonomus grandis grandis]XP_050294579.1 uncharacterized protein LOC126734843 isoform X2 [Anthonomus grandis grandis]XP_050300571.1 uncharacterized protein LOC126739093 isoform X2 [Anthonomus grandis grandis]XP_050300572.1 uncharacterized protein LOC126739093 isoform X2 [Anthonomus grandis grandis]XP_050306422.1 uncharacterized protein LOC126743392 isoform X2 [Anthonomus grandis grandis]XP_050306424.1 uncharacterized protein LOC126743393 iso
MSKRLSVHRSRSPSRVKKADPSINKVLSYLENMNKRLQNIEKINKIRSRSRSGPSTRKRLRRISTSSSSSHESRSSSLSRCISNPTSPGSLIMDRSTDNEADTAQENILVTEGAESNFAAEEHTSPQNNALLSDDVVAILGPKDFNIKKYGPSLHDDLALRWDKLLAEGLSDEDKRKLCEAHLPPKNLSAMAAPKLNPLIEKAVSPSNVSRDNRLAAEQQQVAATLAAIGQLFSSVLSEEGGGNRQHISLLNDTSKLLLDLFHQQSKTRRALIAVNLNQEFQEANKENITPDGFLFGENLEERLKAAKNLEVSGKILKPKPNKTSYKKPLNSKAPSRQQRGTTRREGNPRQYRPVPKYPTQHRAYNTVMNNNPQRKRAVRRWQT